MFWAGVYTISKVSGRSVFLEEFFFLFFSFKDYVYEYIACKHLHAPYVSSTHWGQKKASDPPGLPYRCFWGTMYILGILSRSSAKAASGLNFWTSSVTMGTCIQVIDRSAGLCLYRRENNIPLFFMREPLAISYFYMIWVSWNRFK